MINNHKLDPGKRLLRRAALGLTKLLQRGRRKVYIRSSRIKKLHRNGVAVEYQYSYQEDGPVFRDRAVIATDGNGSRGRFAVAFCNSNIGPYLLNYSQLTRWLLSSFGLTKCQVVTRHLLPKRSEK